MSKGSDRLRHTQVLLRDESCRFGDSEALLLSADRARQLATPLQIALLS